MFQYSFTSGDQDFTAIKGKNPCTFEIIKTGPLSFQGNTFPSAKDLNEGFLAVSDPSCLLVDTFLNN